MNSRATARLPLDPGADPIEHASPSPSRSGEVVAFARPLTALIVVPTLHAGAADAGAIDLMHILAPQRASRHRGVERRPAGKRGRGIGRRVRAARRRELQSGHDAALRVRAVAHRAREALRPHPRAWARGGVERHTSRRACAARAAAHHLVQGFPRAERAQAPLQRRDGARRARDRGVGPARRTDRRALPHSVRAHRGRAGEHRSCALRSGGDFGRAASRRSAAPGA